MVNKIVTRAQRETRSAFAMTEPIPGSGSDPRALRITATKADGGWIIAGVCARVAQRILALTATIWHNDNLGLSIRRSLTAYDH